MTSNLRKNDIVPSLSIEPVDTDEYNRNLVQQLTSRQKQMFLKCIRIEGNFSNAPETYTDLCENLINKLNRQKAKYSQSKWLSIFRTWIDCVSSSTMNQIYSREDQELFSLITSQHSKSLMSNKQSIDSLSSHCRICLASSSTKMIFLFNERPHQNDDNATLLEKLNYCSCFTATVNVDDGLPQYICISCSILIENAYQLKILCAKTEAKLHMLQQQSTVQHYSELEQQSKVSNIRIECDSENVTELNECDEDIRSKENDQKNLHEIHMERSTQKSSKANAGLVDDTNLVDIEYSNDNEHLTTMEKESKTRAIHSKNDESVTVGYQCEHCGKWFRVKNSLAVHMRAHTNERPYKCEVCNKAFKTSSAANNHRVVHNDAKDFKCSECPFRTNTKPNLRIHERTHSRIQPYECKFCSMKFRTASNVVKHMRNIHEKQKSNKCDKCDRSFFTRESLRKHSIIHTSLKPYTCPQCSASYAWYNGLKKHVLAQHSSDNVKLATEKFFLDQLNNLLT